MLNVTLLAMTYRGFNIAVYKLGNFGIKTLILQFKLKNKRHKESNCIRICTDGEQSICMSGKEEKKIFKIYFSTEFLTEIMQL